MRGSRSLESAAPTKSDFQTDALPILGIAQGYNANFGPAGRKTRPLDPLCWTFSGADML